MEQAPINAGMFRVGLLVLATLVGFGMTYLFLTSDRTPTGTFDDTLSGQTVSEDLINDAANVNPYMPYFIGFNSLTKNGISDDDVDYIRDMIEVYVLNEKQVKSAKVSFVENSFKYTNLSEADSNNYEFKFGINGGDIHAVYAKSNFTTSKISVTIKDSASKTVTNREFDILPIN